MEVTSGAGCGRVPGCKSTRTELLPGCTTRWESPATTSTCNGGRTVRLATTPAPSVPSGGVEAGGCVGAVNWGATMARASAVLCFATSVGTAVEGAVDAAMDVAFATGAISTG